jgi:lysyl-tRNA synthetase class 2
VTAPYLRRRQSALRLGLGLLLGLTVLDLLKLDVEAATGSLAAAVVLWLGRHSFYVRHDPHTLRSALRRVPLLAGASLFLCGVAMWIAAPEGASLVANVRATGDALLWQVGPFDFQDELGHLDEAIAFSGALTLAWCAYLLFRRGAPGRVLSVSGDPVGQEAAMPAVLKELKAFAEARGLRLAALGAGERLRPLWEQLGLRSLYLGDEAVVETSTFSLDGRPIRKVRQSVTRLEKLGYIAELHRLDELSDPELAQLEAVSRSWRGGQVERGFAMSLDELRRDDHGDSLVVLGRDGDGRVRGFLHFAPAYGARPSHCRRCGASGTRPTG